MESTRTICAAWAEGNDPPSDVVEKLQNYGPSTRSKCRRHMLNAGMTGEYVDGILPRAHRVCAPQCTTFIGMSGPIKRAIAAALNRDEIPTEMEEWEPTMAIQARDVITSHYRTPVSAAIYISRFRKGLEALGCPEDVVNASEDAQLINELAVQVAKILHIDAPGSE